MSVNDSPKSKLMDYLDPRKQLQHSIILIVGYVLIGIAIVIGTLILVYQAYGFGLGKNGTVIQNGLLFFSSQPHPASITIAGTLKSVKTNTRLSIPAGIYNVQLQRDGYRPWQRTVAVDGGSVEHFDYPFLFPKVLDPKKVQDYTGAPGIISQSRDRRWLLVQQAGTMTGFDVYNLKTPTKPSTPLSLPTTILTKASVSESWLPSEWADDNRHLVLQHIYDGKSEFILVDRTNPEQSINLNTSLSVSPTKLTLNDKKYDQYYLYDVTTGLLQTATLKTATTTPLLQHVLNYQSYGDDTILYATDSGAPAGKTLIRLKIGDHISNIRTFPTGSTYLLDLTKYSGNLYVAAGATAESKVYVYKDPIGQLRAQPNRALLPAQVLHVTAPNYLSFSANAQFIVTENSTEFGVYDIENKNGYHFNVPQVLDAPQSHAVWMDGDRLAYTSGGKLQILDYDNANRQILTASDARYLPVFTPDYKFLYNLSPGPVAGQIKLSQTPLLTTADQ